MLSVKLESSGLHFPVKVLSQAPLPERRHLGHLLPSTLWAQAHDSHLDTGVKTNCTGTCSGDTVSSCCQLSVQLSHCCTQKTILLPLLIRPLGTLCKVTFSLDRQYYSIELSLSLFIALNNHEISYKMPMAS